MSTTKFLFISSCKLLSLKPVNSKKQAVINPRTWPGRGASGYQPPHKVLFHIFVKAIYSKVQTLSVAVPSFLLEILMSIIRL